MSFQNQRSDYLIGSASSDSTLTAAYAGNLATVLTANYEKVTLLIKYTPAQNSRLCTIQVEVSDEQAQFYSETALVDSDLTGTSSTKTQLFTIAGTTASTAYTRVLYFDTASQYMRVSAKEDGVANFGAIHIKIIRNE